MSIVGYCRVSTQRQVDDGLGLQVQAQSIEDWCQRNGHRLVAIETDEAVNGAVDANARPSLTAALDRLATGGADGLLVLRLDRLARSLSTQEAILAQVWRHQSRVFAVDSGEVLEDDPDDPMRTAMRQMMGVFSQLERGMITARLRAGRRLKGETGGYAFGAPPYGYRSVEGALVEDEGETSVLELARTLRDQGRSLRQIGAALAAAGHRPRRGSRWHPQVVARLLARQAEDAGRVAS